MQCLNCNSELQSKRKKYCNLSCATSRTNTLRPRKTLICELCGSSFNIKRRINKYCSNQCREQARISKSLTKGQLFDNCKNWQSARATIRKMARVVFVKCNKPQICFRCGYSKHIEVAHIKAVKDFTDNTLIRDINNIKNLVALCPTHHWEYDNEISIL
jgi:hypothetical protein